MRDIKTRRKILKTANVISRNRRIFKISLVILLFLILFAFCIYLGNTPFLRITDVVIRGNRMSKTDSLISSVKQKLDGRYALVIPRDNILFYPKTEIVQLIRRSDPSLAKVTAEVNLDRQLIIDVVERTPDFLWCNTLDENNKHCYFMDKNGVVFMEAPQFSDNVFIEIVGRTKDDPLGKMTIPKMEFSSLYKFVKVIPNLIKGTSLSGYSIYKITSLGVGDYNIFFRSNSGSSSQNWHLVVNLRGQVASTLANFSTVIDSEVFKKDATDSKRKLDYIDLRFGNKIFYKFQ
jgi:cell division septal protein FtsQ